VNTTASILILEENRITGRMLQETLKRYDVTLLRSLEECWMHLENQHPHVMILDESFDDENFSFIRELRQNPYTSKIRLISILDRVSTEHLQHLFQAGANDFVRKPLDPLDMSARVHIQLQHLQQIQKLELLAHFDPMTHTLNRRAFFEEAQRHIDACHLQRSVFSVILFNIDSLSEINEELGHMTGDKLLHDFATIAKSYLGHKALIGRLGGNGFGALLPGHSESEAIKLAASIQAEAEAIVVGALTPFKLSYHTAREITADETIDTMMQHAAASIESERLTRKTRNY